MYKKINKYIHENYTDNSQRHVSLKFDDDDNITIYKNFNSIFSVTGEGNFVVSATFKSSYNNYINFKAGSRSKYTDLRKPRLNWEKYKALNYLPNRIKTSYISEGLISNYFSDELFEDNYSMDRIVIDQIWNDNNYIDKIENNQYKYETGQGIVYTKGYSSNWDESQMINKIIYNVSNNGKKLKIHWWEDSNAHMTIDIIDQRFSFVKEENTVKLKYTKS